MSRPKRRSCRLFDRDASSRQAALARASASWPRGIVAKNPVMFVVEVGSVLTTAARASATCSSSARHAPLLVHRRRSRSGSGSRSSSPTSPRRWPRAAARPRPTRCARCARRPRRATPGGHGRATRRSRPRRCARATSWSSRPASSSPATARSSRASPRSTSRPSPASRRPSSARAAATARAVTGGTKVLSDRIVVRITADPGESFLDRMIALVEGASRQKTPNEIALHILLVGLTLIFLLACVTLVPLAHATPASRSRPRSIVALLVCLIPTTIGGLLSAIGIAGMDRLLQQERARHERPGGRGGRRRRRAAARQDRHHHPRQPHGDRAHPAAGRARSRSWPTPRSSPAWPTRRPKGARSSCWRKEKYDLRGRELRGAERDVHPVHRPDPHERRRPRPAGSIRKGAVDADRQVRRGAGRHRPRPSSQEIADRIGDAGRHAAGRRRRRPGPGRHPPQGHRQGRHRASASSASAPWASAPS